jgi:hypothetical protein
MNALPLISHRLLASAVAEHRSVRSSSAIEAKSVIIHCNDNWNAPSPGLEKPVLDVPGVTARQLLAPTPISASWPFFE